MSSGALTHCAQPVEALLAHALGQHGDAAAAQDLGDGDAAAAVVAGRGPHRALPRRIEAPGHQARRQAGVGGQHLVRADHREQRAQRHDDARLHAGQRRGQLDVHRGRHPARAREVVEPVHAVQVERVGIVGADLAERAAARPWRSGPAAPARRRSAAGRPCPSAARWRGRAPWRPRPSPGSRTGQILCAFPSVAQARTRPAKCSYCPILRMTGRTILWAPTAMQQGFACRGTRLRRLGRASAMTQR